MELGKVERRIKRRKGMKRRKRRSNGVKKGRRRSGKENREEKI